MQQLWISSQLPFGQFLFLQASSSEEMGRWLGILLAETGSTTDPATLHYDYIDVETTANVIQLAKQSFW